MASNFVSLIVSLNRILNKLINCRWIETPRWPFDTRASKATVKPVCNDHLYNKIYYLWFIQKSVLMMTEDTNLLLLTISAFWSSSRWPLAT